MTLRQLLDQIIKLSADLELFDVEVEIGEVDGLCSYSIGDISVETRSVAVTPAGHKTIGEEPFTTLIRTPPTFKQVPVIVIRPS